jgi:hypothetical protein
LISLDARRCIPEDNSSNTEFYRNKSSAPRKLRDHWNPHEIVAKCLFLYVDLQCKDALVCCERHYTYYTNLKEKAIKVTGAITVERRVQLPIIYYLQDS